MAAGSNLLDLIITNQYFNSDFYIYRKDYESKNAPVFDFTYEYSRVLSVFSIVLVFSVATPVIIPFGCLFMGVKYWLDKYNLLFVYRVEPLAGKNLQGLVLMFIVMILGITQLINSGLFLASGVGFLAFFGGLFALTGLVTVIVSVLLYKYWNPYHSFTTFEPTSKNMYKHPYLSLIE